MALGVAHIQDAVPATLVATSPATSTFPAATTIGNWLIFICTTRDSSGIAISGGGVNTWYQTGLIENSTGSACIYYGKVTSSGQTVVTVTDSGGNNYPSAVGGEFYGLNPVQPLAAGMSTSGTGSYLNTPSPYAGALQMYVAGGYHVDGVASPYTFSGGLIGYQVTTNFSVAVLSSGTTAYNLGMWEVGYAPNNPSGGGYAATASGAYISTGAIFNVGTIQRLGSLMQGGTITDNPLSSTATTMDSAALANFPTIINGGQYAAVTIYDQTGTITTPEVVWITAHASGATSATIVRAQEGSTARSHGQGEAWVNAPTVADYAQQNNSLAQAPYYFDGQEYFDSATGQNYVENGISWVSQADEGLFWMEVGP